MSWYPLWNSLRIAAISSVLVFFLGILCAYYVARLPRTVKGILDVFLTLPMVLPPRFAAIFYCWLLASSGHWGCFWHSLASSLS